jgi:aspartyl-tRNA(Asn)/glutamyl-tRNA(Gln) amidotransferase subunit B
LNDTGLIEEICQKIITDNPQSVADYQQGKQAALMFLVGKVMKETKGQANASMVTQTLTNFLKK